MAKQRYAFRIPKYGDADPQEIGDRIDELIDEKNEHVTSDELVADGRKSTSPLRVCFTYDDAVAAEKWRRKEAKDLIKNLHTEKNGEITKTRAFEYVAHPEFGGKRVLLSHRSAVARPEFREQLEDRILRRTQRELTYFIDSFGGNPASRALVRDAAKLRKQIQRELLQSVA